MNNQHNFIENSLVILTKQTLDIFLKQENPAELIALYTFYYYTAKWQATNQPKCTTDYTAKGLHWSIPRVRKVKKQLIEFGLIEDARIVDPQTKKVKAYYIKMNYIFKKETLEKSQGAEIPPTGFETPKARGEEIEGVAKLGTNALSTNNKNALSTNNLSKKEKEKATVPKTSTSSEPLKEKSIKENIKTFNEIIDSYTTNQQLRNELKEHLKTRKRKKAALSNRAIELSLEELDRIASSDEEKIAIVQNSIVGGWTSFYPLKPDEKKRLKDTPSYNLEDYEDFDIFS